MHLGFIGDGTPKKLPRRCRRFTAYFGQNWDNVVAAGRFPVLKVLKFFSQTFIILYMRLKLDPQNIPKPIPHCSNFIKIIFLKKGPSNNLSTNKYLMSRPHVGLLHWNLSWALTFIILLTRQGVYNWGNTKKFSALSWRQKRNALPQAWIWSISIIPMNLIFILDGEPDFVCSICDPHTDSC